MRKEYILSIVILTMNRKDQLVEALDSCLSAKLPAGTEFVIVDNHSTDGTEEAVEAYRTRHEELELLYEYQAENLGVGGGRSRGFDLARGKYLYFLDDDAVISDESRDSFFIKPIQYLDRNPEVASITTRIKDIVLKSDRDVDHIEDQIDGKNRIFKYLGGSHFLRKSFFGSPLYFSMKYGSEEYAPSIIAQDEGHFHVYFDDIYIIHKPKVNKWAVGTESMEYVLCCGCAGVYATKAILYPAFYRPVLYLAYRVRCYKYLRPYKGAVKKSDTMVRDIIQKNRHKKIKSSTVLKMYQTFGLTVF